MTFLACAHTVCVDLDLRVDIDFFHGNLRGLNHVYRVMKKSSSGLFSACESLCHSTLVRACSIDRRPVEILSHPAEMLSRPAEMLSCPAEMLSHPAEMLSCPAEMLSRPFTRWP